MCSSPKSSRAIRKSKTESMFGKMDSATRTNFTASANRAQERKELRIAKNKELTAARRNEQTKYHKAKSVESKKGFRSNLMATLNQLGFAV
jgi:hypothetical protein